MTDDQMNVSDFTLEQYHLQELPADDVDRIRSRLARDASLRARLAELTRSDADIHQQYPSDDMAREILGRVAAVSPNVTASAAMSWRWAAMALVSTSVVALAVWGPGLRQGPARSAVQDGSSATERVKGDAALVLYRKSGSGSELLEDGTLARSGDLVRVAYRAGAPRFGVIVSLDGSGVVTRHLPIGGDAAAELQAGGTILLDAAYELDNAPKWERFFLITGEAPFSVQAVLDAARAVVASGIDEAPPALALPPEFQQTSFLLRKIS